MRLNARHAVTRATTLLRERLTEREHIARDLHDTLLQDVDALVFNLEAIEKHKGTASSEELHRLGEAGRLSLALARKRVSGLRATAADACYFAVALEDHCNGLAMRYPISYIVQTTGTPWRLLPIAAEEMLAIGQEAILNASRHADATLVTVQLIYRRSRVELVVCDDGKGFDTALLRSGLPGHWGLVGMRERAERIHSDLVISVGNPKGTTVHLKVPRRIAIGRGD